MIKLLGLLLGLILVGPSLAQDSLPDAPNKVRPLMIGDEVPALVLTDREGKPFDLGEHKKPTVLVFYRGHW